MSICHTSTRTGICIFSKGYHTKCFFIVISKPINLPIDPPPYGWPKSICFFTPSFCKGKTFLLKQKLQSGNCARLAYFSMYSFMIWKFFWWWFQFRAVCSLIDGFRIWDGLFVSATLDIFYVSYFQWVCFHKVIFKIQ